jgi:hypothetical protein
VHAITRCELRAAMRCKYYADTVNPKRSYPKWVISVNFVMSAKVKMTRTLQRAAVTKVGHRIKHTCARCDPESDN